MTLLWENAAPTSEFAAQTIEIDLSTYAWVLVVSAYETSGERLTTTLAQKGHRAGAVFTGFWSEGSFGRSFDIEETGVSFFASVNMPRSGSGTTSGKYCIPHIIYGIEGVG